MTRHFNEFPQLALDLVTPARHRYVAGFELEAAQFSRSIDRYNVFAILLGRMRIDMDDLVALTEQELAKGYFKPTLGSASQPVFDQPREDASRCVVGRGFGHALV